MKGVRLLINKIAKTRDVNLTDPSKEEDYLEYNQRQKCCVEKFNLPDFLKEKRNENSKRVRYTVVQKSKSKDDKPKLQMNSYNGGTF